MLFNLTFQSRVLLRTLCCWTPPLRSVSWRSTSLCGLQVLARLSRTLTGRSVAGHSSRVDCTHTHTHTHTVSLVWRFDRHTGNFASNKQNCTFCAACRRAQTLFHFQNVVPFHGTCGLAVRTYQISWTRHLIQTLMKVKTSILRWRRRRWFYRPIYFQEGKPQ